MGKIVSIHGSESKNLSDEPEVKVDYENNRERIVITYNFPGYAVSDVKRKENNKWQSFKEIGMSGAGSYSIDADPLLPCFGRFVQIPSGYSAVKVQYRRFNPVPDKRCTIPWAGKIVWDEDAVRFVKKVHEVDKFFPKKVIEHSGPYYMDGQKVLLVHVRPLQYNPRKRLLRTYGKIKVYIRLSRMEDSAREERDKSWELALTHSFNHLGGFSNFILNPCQEFFQEITHNRNPMARIPDERGTTEFLIIHGKDLKRPAEILKIWKEKRGIGTKIVPIKAVGNDREKIKKYIRHERLIRSPHLRYVLLLGGVAEITVSQEAGKHAEITDHYFYTHRDPDNSECLMPWVSGGRIPVENEEEGLSVVNQIIRYEKEPSSDPEYYKRITLACCFEASKDQEGGYRDGRARTDSLKTMEDIRKHMLSEGFEVNSVYFSKVKMNNPLLYRDGTPVPRETMNQIITDQNTAAKLLIGYVNEGQLIVCHRGHGWWDGWREPRFKTKELKSISGDQQCILFSINCLTGSFHETSKDIFSQKMLALNGGAPTLIAANFITSTWHNDNLARALFDAVWPGIIPVFPKKNKRYALKNCRMGDLLNYAKAFLLLQHGANAETKEQLELYHVIGDPTLEIWGAEPSLQSLGVSMVENTLHITMDTCPRSAILTVWQGDELLKRIKPLNSRVRVALRDLGGEPPYTICLSAPGCRFTEATAWR
ncbi:MAG: C25 family cysteine peptidase [Deltaproteobacteria bacterium]|nr:C25 family cysteine peptidase [Deltaproteobacteria bacterium]